MGFVLLTFGLVLGILFGSYYLFVLRPEANDQKALRQRLQGTAAAAPDPSRTPRRRACSSSSRAASP